MNVSHPPEARELRLEVRGWLEDNLPTGWGTPGFQMTGDERAQFDMRWTRKLADGGWTCASWPREYGGRGLSITEAAVLNEEFERLNAPMREDFFGDTLVGPTILVWGSREQKRTFLPKIVRGEITWCLGLSEADAGSDLGALKTRAELDGDEWVINGQKVWTTQAQYADYILLLCRTDPDASPSKGISYLIVPMHEEGIAVRPITQMDGSPEFNEVFFTDVRCPLDSVLGGVNNGWQIAMSTLGFERGTSVTTGYRRFREELDIIINVARSNGKLVDPLIRQRLALAWSKVKIMQINGLRTLTSSVNDDRSTAALGATNKMFWSEYHQDAMELAIDILGMEGQILTGSEKGGADGWEFVPGVGRRHPRPGYPVSQLQTSFFYSRSESIWGGTAQIQRNTVAERILGLPRDSKHDTNATAR